MHSDMSAILKQLPDRVSRAVGEYWLVRDAQQGRQMEGGRIDQGARSAVTGGAQMRGFIDMLVDLIASTGVESQCIYRSKTALQLPGFFRPTKEWDLLVVRENKLLAALEAKSQVGPSFGNNFNNRTEEAMGSALDLWTAFREGAFGPSSQPFLGYLFMLEECDASLRAVRVDEPHFEVFPEFRGASYLRRYELFCRKLVRERQYSAAALVTSQRTSGRQGTYAEPAEDLSAAAFVRALMAHLTAFVVQ